jgi:hypothetical protein
MDAQQQQNLNGRSEEAIGDSLQDEFTIGYKPVMPLEALWMSGSDMPQITLRRDIEFMQMHPIVSIALEYYKSGIYGAEFWGGPDERDPTNDQGKPISPDPRVAAFALAHAERFWQRGMPLMQEGGYPYGWAPGEHIYQEAQGMLVWSHLKGFHPNDGFILTLAHQPVGVRIKGIREPVGETEEVRRRRIAREEAHGGYKGGAVDLWFAERAVPAKAAWYPHRPRFNQFYGRSQLIGAWRPWRRLGWRDAVEQVIDAAVYRAGYRGPLVRFPPGHSAATAKQGVPATTVDGAGGSRRENRDTARQIGEWGKAGATYALSSEKYPEAQGGGYKWDLEFPQQVINVDPLVGAARYLEDQIMLGMGVPPELVKAGGTGSGYSGRSVPREAFLVGQQRIADAMLQIFVEQVIRPLVLWNFGDVPFSLQCKSLLQSQADDTQGDEGGAPPPQMGGGPPTMGAPPGMLPPGAVPPGMVPPQMAGAPMSLESRAMEVVRRYRERRGAVLATDKGGREHRGKGKGGGQFVKKGSSGGGEATGSGASKSARAPAEPEFKNEVTRNINDHLFDLADIMDFPKDQWDELRRALVEADNLQVSEETSETWHVSKLKDSDFEKLVEDVEELAKVDPNDNSPQTVSRKNVLIARVKGATDYLWEMVGGISMPGSEYSGELMRKDIQTLLEETAAWAEGL